MAITMKEVQNWWLRGPMTQSEVDEMHGKGIGVAAKRFGLWQNAKNSKTKMSHIDDVSGSGQNASATWTMVALTRFWAWPKLCRLPLKYACGP
eukprot:3046350-Amphidinium_carterae.1